MTTTTTTGLRRPSWRDPRLGLGVLLVAGSVALGSWIVGEANRTVEVYAAPEVLTPGEPLEVEDLAVIQVGLAGAQDLYLLPGQLPEEELVITRTVHAGEMVPMSAVGPAAGVDVRTVAVPITAALAETIAPGSQVDLWVTMPDDASAGAAAEGEPELLVEAVEVAAIAEDTSLFAGPGTMQAHLLVDVADLPGVLAATSADAPIAVVPLPGSGAA
ncbi:hypothetical protein IM660_13625 [Ruania alkalisoli]|uniref:SAF domain-containing protein n=1 Tax=Ruania alkalisoli TaxID=2779775 RepID=A0A7M1SSE3_9MICO|nr:hypothetical protein [Ruania alkalisoli]QOR69702.1 hypothetical protein IM660_13625 [Ruania alkalisoli]